MRAFGYSLIAFDAVGVNLFFVDDKEIGAPVPHTFASLSPDYSTGAWQALMPPCQQQAWARVDAGGALAGPDFLRQLHPVILKHDDRQVKPGDDAVKARAFRELEMPHALSLHRHRRHAAAAGGAAAATDGGGAAAADGDGSVSAVRGNRLRRLRRQQR